MSAALASSAIGEAGFAIVIVAAAAFTLRRAIAAQMARHAAAVRKLVTAVRSEERKAAAERESELRSELAAATEAAVRADARSAGLASIAAGFARMARGDLTVRFSDAREVDPIASRLDQVVALMGKTMFAFSSSLDAILASAAEMNASVDAYGDEISKLAARTQAAANAFAEQMESTAELAAPLSTSASLLRTLVDEASLHALTAGQGGRTLGDIGLAAKQIAPILTLVDEIAFQTNFLALNAGVEAARLGDAGRGVAVVAQELRALSKRAADAAKQSSALLSRVVADAERGVGELSAIETTYAAFSERAAKITGSLEQIGLKLAEGKGAGVALRTLTSPLAAAASARIRLKDEMTGETESLEKLIGKLSTLIDRFAFPTGNDAEFRATPLAIGAFANSDARNGAPRSLPSPATRRARGG